MYFKPIDEMSLRHLVTSPYGEEVLKMSYFGPVLDPSGNLKESPDCLLLDKRTKDYKIVKCEFKFNPSNYLAFKDNGEFDIAIFWEIGAKGLTKEKLRSDLEEHNKCQEIIVLSSDYHKQFANLDDYKDFHIKTNKEQENILQGFYEFQRKAEKWKAAHQSAFMAYIAARLHPEMFLGKKMTQALKDQKVMKRGIPDRGKGAFIAALTYTKIFKHMYDDYYCWNDDINPYGALKVIEKIFVEKLRKDLPDSDIIYSVRADS